MLGFTTLFAIVCTGLFVVMHHILLHFGLEEAEEEAEEEEREEEEQQEEMEKDNAVKVNEEQGQLHNFDTEIADQVCPNMVVTDVP